MSPSNDPSNSSHLTKKTKLSLDVPWVSFRVVNVFMIKISNYSTVKNSKNTHVFEENGKVAKTNFWHYISSLWLFSSFLMTRFILPEKSQLCPFRFNQNNKDDH